MKQLYPRKTKTAIGLTNAQSQLVMKIQFIIHV